jgi:mannose-1-phosphate guanylyltransferase / mannose-6-phosphate isomerase
MSMNLISVILSGGAGTRLWPVSRQFSPKPFMTVKDSSLLSQAIARGLSCGASQTLVVTNRDYYFPTRQTLLDMPMAGDKAATVTTKFLLEPEGRNTAPAIALAALQCERDFGCEAVMLVLPADHLIFDAKAFAGCVDDAVKEAKLGNLVTFGIPPSHPDTGFGYIEVQKAGVIGAQMAMQFVEKPNTETAQKYVDSGRFYWNSGMFCFTAAAILDAMLKYCPDVLSAARLVSSQSSQTEDSIQFSIESFANLPSISIDYAVMEHASNVVLIPARFDWSDVGTWAAVSAAHSADNAGNTLFDGSDCDVVSIDTKNTHIQVQAHHRKVVATVGVENLVIVDTPDALLVASKSASQNVKSVVEHLKRSLPETTQLPAQVQRPWGTYMALKEEVGYKVKRITVRPSQSLSLQFHHQRAEHWVVVQGVADVQVGDQHYETRAGQYRYIPLKEKHRLTNTGQDELILIEVQCGDYLGEDDIVRIQDNYGRV